MESWEIVVCELFLRVNVSGEVVKDWSASIEFGTSEKVITRERKGHYAAS
jgi:hypothetical protein